MREPSRRRMNHAAASRFASFQIMFNRSRSRHVLNGGRVRPYIVLVLNRPKTKKGDQANRNNTTANLRNALVRLPRPEAWRLKICASSNGLRASQVAVGRGQGHSPDTKEYGRAIWTVNAVNHGGVTFRRFGRPNFTRSARECCSTARAYSKRRWLKSEISVAIKILHLMR
jgi:hypothetical protein